MRAQPDEGAVEGEGSGVRKRLRIYPRQVQLMPLLARGSFPRAVDGVQKAQKKPQEGKSKNNKIRKSAEAMPRILNILTLDSECRIRD